MTLDVLRDCTFTGPALPEPFVRFELEKELTRAGLLSKTTGAEGRALQESWEVYRRKLRELAVRGGAVRVRNHVIEPLLTRLGYVRFEASADVETREGRESGGHLLFSTDDMARLRTWSADLDEDLDAPARRGAAYRYSHVRIAQRVLLASGERLGLLTNGVELRILISDPARPDSQITIPVDPDWKRSRDVPDSYRLLLALASPDGVRIIPDLIEKARLQQTRVTRELRVQARQAIEHFIQEVLDHPENRPQLIQHTDRDRLAKELWREGLVVIYRLLFVLKLESTDDPARSFSFASTSLWRNTFSPSVALAPHVRAVLDRGAETGRFLEDGLRALFRMFTQGLQCTELHIYPLGGALFGEGTTPILSGLRWGERAVAHLLDRLLWTPKMRGSNARERVHYGPLDVEDLGRVYEALLELEPGISQEPMCRLRRQKLEVVVPASQGERYRPASAVPDEPSGDPGADDLEEALEAEEEVEEAEDEAPARGRKTKVEWIEEIPPGRFYLRVGLGRKASGSYYTPHSFVRFLVQETLGPQVAERSPQDDPQPGKILQLRVLDPAMGSGHFLVEACRFLGEGLYEACRLCDEKALEAERRAEKAKSVADREVALQEARAFRQRVIDLPDPEDELVRYLPSHAPEGQESGLSQRKAKALCRRLVAVHCLYGVDKNPLAVGLAKLSLWIESHAEGLPLTFLDHRLVVGDSLTGPFFEHLLKYPSLQEPMDDLFTRGLRESLTKALGEALKHVSDLEASIGVSLSEVQAKESAKARLDRALAPFKIIAVAWAGGVMLGRENCDDPAYVQLVRAVSQTGGLPDNLAGEPRLLRMIARGLDVEEVPAARADLLALLASRSCVPALPYEFTFPEVFFPQGRIEQRKGFHAVFGNPPWDALQPLAKEFFAAMDLRVFDAPTRRERAEIERKLTSDSLVQRAFTEYCDRFDAAKRIIASCYVSVNRQAGGSSSGAVTDLWQVFAERGMYLLAGSAYVGWVLPSAFHANQSATGVRDLYFNKAALKCCYSFENRRKLFEIDSRFKFALVVAARGGSTDEFPCAFYLHDDEWLFGDRGDRELHYALDFVKRTGGEYLSLLELHTPQDAEVARICFNSGEPFSLVRRRVGVRFGEEMHMSKCAHLFTPTDQILHEGEDPRHPDIARLLLNQDYLALHEGKTFHQYDDRWGERPRYIVHFENLTHNFAWLEVCRYFRLAFRAIASSTNERTGIFCVLPPGVVFGNSSPCEREPKTRPNSAILHLQACANSFSFDWSLRQKSSANVNLFILDGCPLPRILQGLSHLARFLVHSALRLTCNHAGYEPLWREQMGDAWREPKVPFTWPVLVTDDERWEVRAAIDTVVADVYGLTREQYTHVLSTFSHRSYPKAPELCLEKFDELKATGLEAFTQKHDPSWDIPLNESLPQPVIDLPVPASTAAPVPQGELALSTPGRRHTRRGRACAAQQANAPESLLAQVAEGQAPYDSSRDPEAKPPGGLPPSS